MNAPTLLAEAKAPQSQHEIIPQDPEWYQKIADIIIEQITTVPSNSKSGPMRENREDILAKRYSFAEYLQKNLRVETTEEGEVVLVCGKDYREHIGRMNANETLKITTEPEISYDAWNASHIEPDIARLVLVARIDYAKLGHTKTVPLNMYRLFQSFGWTQKEARAVGAQQSVAALAVNALDTPAPQA